jgi:hypothetical protein
MTLVAFAQKANRHYIAVEAMEPPLGIKYEIVPARVQRSQFGQLLVEKPGSDPFHARDGRKLNRELSSAEKPAN